MDQPPDDGLPPRPPRPTLGATGPVWSSPADQPPLWYPPQPEAPANGFRWGAALVAFVLVGVLPAIVIVNSSTAYDETATGSVSAGSLLVLVGIALIAGLSAGAVTFAVASMRNGARTPLTIVLLALSAGAGFCVGLAGAFAVTLERHPTWDDA